MKNIGMAFIATIFIFFFSLIVVSPIIMKIGYSSVEGSYHAATHAILLSLIFVIIVCTSVIIEEIHRINKKPHDD
ncbi:MAG: hypothetical protein GX329_00240 [Tissierellia bacterium]|nr:hypothetical protein [Tissierellia bacterium]